jgi:hypothetical protein
LQLATEHLTKGAGHVARLPSISSYAAGSSRAASYNGSPINQTACPSRFNQILEPTNEFPEADLCHDLCELYFAHINSWLPILSKDATFKSLFRVAAQQLEPAEKILLHAIMATSMRFSTDRRLTPQARRTLHQSLSGRVQLYCLGNTSVMSLQALLILTLDLVEGQNSTPAWNMLNLLVTSAEQLGLNKESLGPEDSASALLFRPEKAPSTSRDFEVETRRRLMWAIYIIDRLAAVCEYCHLWSCFRF